ncbi:MAG TPA: response regulator, partial [Longimicrobium sp.]
MGKCRILIADDEELARERLRALLAGEPEFAVVAEARDGEEAARMIADAEPDVVLLDVDMPELDGFGVVERVGAERMPATVFVTAYDEYAIRAFEANAVDYLLKPVSRERLRTALDRARARIGEAGGPRIDPRFLAWIQANAPAAAPTYRERVTVRHEN